MALDERRPIRDRAQVLAAALLEQLAGGRCRQEGPKTALTEQDKTQAARLPAPAHGAAAGAEEEDHADPQADHRDQGRPTPPAGAHHPGRGAQEARLRQARREPTPPSAAVEEAVAAPASGARSGRAVAPVRKRDAEQRRRARRRNAEREAVAAPRRVRARRARSGGRGGVLRRCTSEAGRARPARPSCQVEATPAPAPANRRSRRCE